MANYSGPVAIDKRNRRIFYVATMEDESEDCTCILMTNIDRPVEPTVSYKINHDSHMENL